MIKNLKKKQRNNEKCVYYKQIYVTISDLCEKEMRPFSCQSLSKKENRLQGCVKKNSEYHSVHRVCTFLLFVLLLKLLVLVLVLDSINHGLVSKIHSFAFEDFFQVRSTAGE